jgi:hypothetical protein
MIWFLLFCGLVWFGLVKYAEWKNPRLIGRFEHRPKVSLQEESTTVARPKQGSSRGETADSGVLYLVSHDGFNSVKIGISSNSSKGDRLQDHTQYGWKVDGLWVFDRLRNAEQVEGAVIAWWRNTLSLPPSCKPEQMPQGGYTETVSLSSLNITQITPFVEDLVQRTDGQKAIQVPISKVIPGASMRVEGKLKYASLDYRTAIFQGNYGVGRINHEWHRWVINDGTGELLIEMRGRDAVPLRFLRVNSTIEVTGRVEEVRSVYRMTNPVYRVISVGKSGKPPKREMTNEGIATTLLRMRSRRKPNASKKSSAHTSPMKKATKPVKVTTPRTGFEAKLEEKIEQRHNLSSAHLAERCSSCGALVGNGAAHDCK